MSKKPALMPKAERREEALKIALKLARKVGARRVSMAMVAAAQHVTAPLLFHIFDSRAGLLKAILKAAKAQGIELPDGAPTIREARELARKAAGKKPVLKKLKAPVKRAAPVKLAKLKKPAAKKTIKVPVLKTGVAKNVKIDAAPKQRRAVAAPAAPAGRKPLTDAQRDAKRARDRARREATQQPATTPAAKFAALPTPFEASLAQV